MGLKLAAIAVVIGCSASAAWAGPIERACLKSDRKAASRPEWPPHTNRSTSFAARTKSATNQVLWVVS